MTDQRPKLNDHLRLRSLLPRTIHQYEQCAAVFVRYHGGVPIDDLGSDEVRRFLLHLAEMGRCTATRAVYHAALKHLFASRGRGEVMNGIPRPRVRTQVPGRALTRAEARALLDLLAPHPYEHAFFALMLATGLRISEVAALQVGDIDRRAGLLHVRHGKGGKPRSVMLSAPTLRMLERYWRAVRPRVPHLFPARRSGVGCPLGDGWTDRAVRPGTMAAQLKRLQGDVPRRVRSHDLRRTFATWLIEDGVDLRVVQVLLGHASPQTTARYTRVHPNRIASMRSPFDRL